MKFVRFLLFLGAFMPAAVFGAGANDFQGAAKLLSAARRGDIRTVQTLINSGVDVNYVDATGLSLVCTAVMNNDKSAIQVLQMYGADASQCDRQIKKYRQRNQVAQYGEDYSFFSGLSSPQVLVLSAAGIAAVIGGVVLLTDVFDDDNSKDSSPSGGSHSGGGGGGSSSGTTAELTIPYGPAYLTSAGVLDTGFDVTTKLPNWDTQSGSGLRVSDFDYLRRIINTGGDVYISQADLDGINPELQNYLLVMGGYYSFANGYMGQYTFRDKNSNYSPIWSEIKISNNPLQGQPVRVALITGNGINPAGSADSANGITYALGTSLSSGTRTVDKYLNYTEAGPEDEGFDFSGSGSAFNPFANVNDSALAKIVAGWEAGRAATDGDLYGFVPNGQLAIYRTGNGKAWGTIAEEERVNVGSFLIDLNNDGKLTAPVGTEEGQIEQITLNGNTYEILTALSLAPESGEKIITVNNVKYALANNSQMFVGKCVAGTGCTDIIIYVGTDGAWYVNVPVDADENNNNNVDYVYVFNSDTNVIQTYKTQVSTLYKNFDALKAAVGNLSNVDVVANTNILPASRQINYITTATFPKSASLKGVSNLMTYYSNLIDAYYGSGEGGIAHNLFNNYSSSKPMMIMPAGDYLLQPKGGVANLYTLDATFENYAPLLYGNNLKHNFMTVVAVNHVNGTSASSTITGYGDGVSSGLLQLSVWQDDNDDLYMSRKCGVAGTGKASASVDPWCFAASGATAEMATAAAAGAFASVKSAFEYMSNDQLFTLLALTADGPFLGTSTSGSRLTTDTLAVYLKTMYAIPLEYDISSLSNEEYLNVFKDVYGYGLINLERALKPGYSIYYYSAGNIVSTSGKNKFWGNVANTSRASTILSLTNRSAIKTSFYDILESADGSLSLPRVWNNTVSLDNSHKHGLYMGDVLGEFDVGTKQQRSNQVGNFEFSMSMSQRAYNDNLNGLDNLRVMFSYKDFDIGAEYQRHLTNGESRFDGRANGLLGLVSNAITSDVTYKNGHFGFGGRAFSGMITDENLLEKDPVVSSQFEPGRLGSAFGGEMLTTYNNDSFNLSLSVGNVHENNTVLGTYSDGMLTLRGGNTQYIDVVTEYKPFENVKMSVRGTFANTTIDETAGLIAGISNLQSNAFAFGLDIGGFSVTAAMPLAVVKGKMSYDYADFQVVENDGKYEIFMDNPHVEYVDLSAYKREFRLSSYYKQSIGDFTDAGVGFIYRVNPNNTDMFGNESILMFKLNHRIGI